jgi:hypothetical protein
LSAIAEEEVDQRLVGNLGLDRELLEVFEGLFIEPDRDLLLQKRRA